VSSVARKGDEGILLLVVLLIAAALATGKIKMPGVEKPYAVTPVGGYGQLVNLYLQGRDVYRGTAVNVTAELWTNDNKQLVSEYVVDSTLTNISSSLPNDFNGYIMLGKDNFVTSSGYEVGDNYYYTKYPVSWSGKQGIISYDNIPVYAEEIATGSSLWTFYDDNTAETTPNITVGSGGTYSAASVKLMSSSNNCTGNPELDGYNGKKAIGFCFNATNDEKWKEIKPNINSGAFTRPGWLSGKSVVDCYYVTDSLCDGSYFETDLYFEAEAGENPGISTVTNESYTIVNDTTYNFASTPVFKVVSVMNDTTDIGLSNFTFTNTSFTTQFGPNVTAGTYKFTYTIHDYIHIIPVDLCYYVDDNLKWAVGFGDESSLTSDTDCGMDSSAQALKVWIA